MKTLFAFVVGLLVVPVLIYCYFRFGHPPVAATDPPLPLEENLAMSAVHRRVDQEAPKTTPIQPSTENYVQGVRVYRENCAVCHGLPEQSKTAIAEGMSPDPPELFKGTGVTDDTPGETYWKVKNGIRMTGMPGYGKRLSDAEMWQVSLLLANANKLPAEAQQALKQPFKVE